MKKLIYILLLLPTLVFGQSGEGYINYKSYKTHYGTGASSTLSGVTYSGGANSTAEFDAMVDTNQPGTTLTNSGEVSPFGGTGLNGGHPPKWGGSYFAIVYSGWFKPNKNGTYNIRTLADDSSETRYREVGTTTWSTMTYQWGCCSYVYGTATLDNTKWYEFEFRYQEYGGGDYYYFEYSIPANSSSPIYNRISSQHEFGTWTNIEPTTEATHGLDLTYEVSDNLDATKFSTTIYYECTDNAGGICATVNTLGSDGTISFDETAINTDQVSTGTYSAETVDGGIQYIYVYNWDSTNERHRVGLDKRMFNTFGYSGFASGAPTSLFQSVTHLKFYDVIDEDVEYKSNGTYWAEYWLNTRITSDMVQASSSTNRFQNGSWPGYGGVAVQSIDFVLGNSFAQHTLNLSVDGTYYNDEYDNVITVQDLVIAFNQLTSGGSGPGNSGGSVFSTGIEYVLGDVNEDGSFNFVDTQLMLQHIYGDTDPFADKTFSDVVKIFNSGYDDWSTTNWSNGIPSSTSDSYTPNSTTLEQSKTYQVAFMGDVNFSHSHEPSNLTTAAQSMSVRYSSAKGSSSEEDSIGMEINKIDGHLQIVLTIPSNNYNIVGTQFKVYYDSDKLEYLEAEYVSPTEIDGYVTVRDRYINIGSLSQDGSVNANQGITYALHFKMNTDLDSTLGLLGLKFYELVDGDGNKVNLKIK
jgi:hypothetical protein